MCGLNPGSRFLIKRVCDTIVVSHCCTLLMVFILVVSGFQGDGWIRNSMYISTNEREFKTELCLIDEMLHSRQRSLGVKFASCENSLVTQSSQCRARLLQLDSRGKI